MLHHVSAPHQPFPGYIHCIAVDCIDQVLLHLRDIYHSTRREFLELDMVYASPVKGKYVSVRVIEWFEYETVVRGSGGVLDVRGDNLIGVYVGILP